MITVIALLSAWAILATITAVDNENRRSILYDECAELQEECEKQERAYDKLKAEHSDMRSAYLKGLAYEWLYDMRCNFTEEGYDAELALDEICQREGLTSAEKSSIRIYANGIAKYE